MSEQQKPVATLTFNFYRELGVSTKIDFDEKDIRVLKEETLLPIFTAKALQSFVSDFLEGGTFGEMVALQVATALRVNDEE